jgi:hypothetical protein
VNGAGTDNNDGARQAAKRLVAKLRQDHPHLKLSITAASLRSNAPHMEPLHPYGYHSILGVKAGEHAYLFQQVEAAEHAGRLPSYARYDRDAGRVPRFRLAHAVPRKASHPDGRVTLSEYWAMSAPKGQHVRWVTA